MRLRDVFIPGGQPNVTYVARSRFNLETQLSDYLETGHSLFSITGPTKSGKTVLCRNVVAKDDAIWLSGGDIATADDVWLAIIDDLNTYSSVSNEDKHTSTSETSSELGASASIKILAGAGKIGDRNASTQARGDVRTRTRPLGRTAVGALLESGKILIVDDFHYIARDTQVKLVRTLKQPIFDGTRVVVLAVPHRRYDVVRVEKEMTGRVGHLEIPQWTVDELREIPDLGFPALNVVVNNKLKDRFVHESFANPHLMQTFCQRL